jgi:hypothetical protein
MKMIETKKLPCILPLPVSSHKQVLLWSFVCSLSSSFPLHSLCVHVIVPVIGPVSCPLVFLSIPFMSMSLYPSLVVSLSISPPPHEQLLAAVVVGTGLWWVLVASPSLVIAPCFCPASRCSQRQFVVAGRQVGGCGCVGWVVVSLFGPVMWHVGAVRPGVTSLCCLSLCCLLLHHCM